MSIPIIEIKGATILQIGGYRITVEPIAASSTPTLNERDHAPARGSTPGEWRIAEAELQSKTNMPFEAPSPCRTERLAFTPRAGGKYRAVSGTEKEIAKVVGRDGQLWFIIDTNGRAVALKRIDFGWHALPPDVRRPAAGEIIVHKEAQSVVADVIGEAAVGGWAVKNTQGVALHVIHGEVNHWVSLGAADVEPADASFRGVSAANWS